MRTQFDFKYALKQYTAFDKEPKEIDPIKFADWCVEGAIIQLSNLIWTVIDNGGTLDYNLAKGCKCGCCNEWQLLDENGTILYSAEDLKDFLKYDIKDSI